MKRVISVSLGSSARDHSYEVTLSGERYLIERYGTDGDMSEARRLIKELSTRVDAIGLGGIDLKLTVEDRVFYIREALALTKEIEGIALVDGSGLKNTLEPRIIQLLQEERTIDFRGKQVLFVCASDRYALAKALEQAGAKLIIGDLIFGLGIPWPLYSLRAFSHVATAILPVVTQLPFNMLYPTGAKQNENKPERDKYFAAADIIAGDFHYIKRYMPKSLYGKVIITNTLTAKDIEDLRARGVSMVISTTPEMGERSFGTNVMEALMIASKGAKQALTDQEYLQIIDEMGLRPRIIDFYEKNCGREGAQFE